MRYSDSHCVPCDSFQNIQKIKYAKWKAAAIARDIRGGRPGADDPRGPSPPHPSLMQPKRPIASDAALSNAKTHPPIVPPKAPSPDSSASRYLVPPQQQGAAPSVPSSFGSLPASANNSTNPSPSAITQVPLPASPAATATNKLPSPKLGPQPNATIPEQSLSTSKEASSSFNRSADTKPSPTPITTTSTLPPATTSASGPPATRPRTRTNENLPPKGSFFSSIAGRVFGTRDGQTTPGGWSNQATPGTEDTFRLPVPTPAVSAAKNDPKPSPPVGLGNPSVITAATRSLLGASATTTATSAGDTTPRSLGSPISGPTEARPELRRAIEHAPSPLSSSIVANGVNASSSSDGSSKLTKQRSSSPTRQRDTSPNDNQSQTRKNDPSPQRGAGGVTRRPPSPIKISVPAEPAVIGKPPSGLQRARGSMDDQPQPRREEAPPMPWSNVETERTPTTSHEFPQLGVPSQPIMLSRIAALKKVHFSGSVVGGLSSVASISPPSSPIRETHDTSGTSVPPPPVVQSMSTPGGLDLGGRRPRPLSTSDMTDLIPVITPSVTKPVTAQDSSSSGKNTISLHSRHQSDSTSKTSFPSAANDSAAASNPIIRIHKNPFDALPAPVPVNRQRAQSFGEPSSAGSVGSWTTLAPNNSNIPIPSNLKAATKTSPRPTMPQILPLLPNASDAPSPSARPMTIPPISRTLPTIQVSQQPTPSPSPPHTQLTAQQLSTSPVSYTAVSGPSHASATTPSSLPATINSNAKPHSGMPSIPPTPNSATSAKFTIPATPTTNNDATVSTPKAAAAHIPTPYTRPDDLPTVLAAEFMLNARKHTKYAMSALEFDDVQTARRELRLALEKLEAYSQAD